MIEDQQIKPDSDLWNEFISGSDEAFHLIYDTHIQSLNKFGLHFTTDEYLVQDCIQDLFIDLHKYRSKLMKTNNIKLYLFVSLKRKIIRAKGKEEKYVKITNENISFIYPLTNDDDTENEVQGKRVELLEKAMNELNNRQREAVYLRYVSELTYEELAEVLQVNYQSARNLIYRSMEKLRESCRKNSLFLMFIFLSRKTFKKNQIY